jgi:hypothetical protein
VSTHSGQQGSGQSEQRRAATNERKHVLHPSLQAPLTGGWP